MQALILLLLCAALGACGFHLRRPPRLPAAMKMTYIQAPNLGSELVRSLRRSIASSAAHLTDSQKQASATLHILRDRSSNRLLSVNRRGRPSEYQLVYAVIFSLDVHGKRLIKPQSLSLTRSYRYSEVDVLGSRQESHRLLHAMQQDMAQLILRRLQAASGKISDQKG